MSKVFLDMAMSLDGFISGPNGEDGGLHNWYFSPSEASRQVIDNLIENIGAMIVGRRAYGAGGNGENVDQDPYQMPHFIITHRTPEPGTNLDPRATFVTEGIERALELARAAAREKDICVAGGANIAQQFLKAGLLDELRIHLVPVLLGEGVRLFDHLDDRGIKLERTRAIEAKGVTHLRFDVISRE